MCVSVSFACMSAPCSWSVQGGQERTSGPLELELQLWGFFVCTGGRNPGPLAISPSPKEIVFNRRCFKEHHCLSWDVWSGRANLGLSGLCAEYMVGFTMENEHHDHSKASQPARWALPKIHAPIGICVQTSGGRSCCHIVLDMNDCRDLWGGQNCSQIKRKSNIKNIIYTSSNYGQGHQYF